jgi:hypothetical protein
MQNNLADLDTSEGYMLQAFIGKKNINVFVEAYNLKRFYALT